MARFRLTPRDEGFYALLEQDTANLVVAAETLVDLDLIQIVQKRNTLALRGHLRIPVRRDILRDKRGERRVDDNLALSRVDDNSARLLKRALHQSHAVLASARQSAPVVV